MPTDKNQLRKTKGSPVHPPQCATPPDGLPNCCYGGRAGRTVCPREICVDLCPPAVLAHRRGRSVVFVLLLKFNCRFKNQPFEPAVPSSWWLPKVISENAGPTCRLATTPGRASLPFLKLLLATGVKRDSEVTSPADAGDFGEGKGRWRNPKRTHKQPSPNGPAWIQETEGARHSCRFSVRIHGDVRNSETLVPSC